MEIGDFSSAFTSLGDAFNRQGQYIKTGFSREQAPNTAYPLRLICLKKPNNFLMVSKKLTNATPF